MKLPTPLFPLLAAFLLAGCSRGPEVTIVNGSPVEITNVVASGTGFAQALGSIPSGGQRRCVVRPTGESGVRLDFEANGQRFSTLPQGYFENHSHYRITATVAPDFTVTVDERP